MTLYQQFITPATETTLAQLYADQDATGTTPEQDLDVLVGLIVAAQAKRILQFGTFLGGSALVLADVARRNAGPDGGAIFVTVDPRLDYNASCRKYAGLAGLGDVIETIDGFSTDPAVLKILAGRAWDAVFLDTTHQYDQTCAEIRAIAPLCGPQTLFLFHDASHYAAETLDVNHQGGVRRAIREFCLTNPKWQSYVFERPAFGQYGIGVMSRKVAL